jgi:hypothetical protein
MVAEAPVAAMEATAMIFMVEREGRGKGWERVEKGDGE